MLKTTIEMSLENKITFLIGLCWLKVRHVELLLKTAVETKPLFLLSWFFPSIYSLSWHTLMNKSQHAADDFLLIRRKVYGLWDGSRGLNFKDFPQHRICLQCCCILEPLASLWNTVSTPDYAVCICIVKLMRNSRSFAFILSD